VFCSLLVCHCGSVFKKCALRVTIPWECYGLTRRHVYSGYPWWILLTSKCCKFQILFQSPLVKKVSENSFPSPSREFLLFYNRVPFRNVRAKKKFFGIPLLVVFLRPLNPSHPVLNSSLNSSDFGVSSR
jgi:hypothetical protein